MKFEVVDEEMLKYNELIKNEISKPKDWVVQENLGFTNRLKTYSGVLIVG